jgi:SPP1 gp7 family putative phage head morphogenesis protein
MPEFPFPSIPDSEAIAALERRGVRYRPSGHWTEMWQNAHQTAFTVAQSAGFDVLKDIHGALLRAMSSGLTFEQFRKELTPVLQAKGWWGVASRVDDLTGEVREVQLGSPRRLRTIFDVNLRVSAAQGDWARQQQVKEERPFLRYTAILDNRVRPQHRRWHGTILPTDHPWWKTHYPPNGWRCRCKAMSVSADDIADNGWEVGEPPDEGTAAWVNPRMGEVMDVPRGIDPGWDYNPGDTDAAARAAKTAMDKLADYPPRLGAAAVPALAFAFPQVERELAEWIEGIAAQAEAGQFHATGARRIVGAFGDDVLTFLEERQIPISTAAISIGDADVLHALRSTKVAPLPVDVWKKLPTLLTNPTAIYWDLKKPGLIYVFEMPDDNGKVVVLINHQTRVERVRAVVNTVRTGRRIKTLDEFNDRKRYDRIR